MKKFLLLGLVIFLLGIAFVFVNRTFQKGGNPLPLTILKTRDIREKLPQGSDLETPLNIPSGFRMAIFADLKSIGAPRILAFDPSGTLLVSIPGSGKIIALPDKDENGTADQRLDVVTDLNRPHGIDFSNGKIYIAETDGVVRYDYDPQNFSVKNRESLFSLQPGGNHYTRTIKIHGNKLYTSIGSSCNVCIEKDFRRSSIIVSNLDGSDLRVYAKGLRNTVFFVFDEMDQIWGNDMGRDLLGDNLPPDELNLIKDGSDYGWPWCYGNRVRDRDFRGSENTNYCEATTGANFKYPAHVAPLGITFINSPLFMKENQGDILVSFHGSWNSSVPVGYKIVKLDIQNGKVTKMEDFITGWITQKREVLGRPVDLIFNKKGVLYISDDKANLIYILTK